MIKELTDVQAKKLSELSSILNSIRMFLSDVPKQTCDVERAERNVGCLADAMKRNDDLLNEISQTAIEISKVLKGE